ncbi:MAG: hypothetical protein AB7G75_17810 [Candidatus Binatia bacterium]
MEQEAPETLPYDESLVAILRYLLANPTAKDSIQGITNWWLPQISGRLGKRKIKASLDLLVSKGWLIGRSSLQSEIIYWLNESKVMEIEKFLDEGQ